MKQAGTKDLLWRCPKCGHRFVTRNIWHSCGHYRLADHFEGKASLVRTESFGRLGYGHHFRLCNPNEIDRALVEFLGEAYSIGQQDPLKTTASKKRFQLTPR